MSNELKDKQVFILDMDGTFYLGDKPIPGALEFLDLLKSKGKRYIFFTNNSSKSIGDYHMKLEKMGVEVKKGGVMSSGTVTIDYLNRNRKGKKVYLVGTPSLLESFKAGGIDVSDKTPDIVVLGFDTTLTYEKIHKACTFIREGAEFIATHPDANCPIEGGFMPDTGSMIKMFTESTGVKPVIMGKPFPHTVKAIEAATGTGRDEIAFVGDRLQTDIAIGVKNGATSVLVMTGATDEKTLEESDMKPSHVFKSIADIGKVL